MQIICLNLPPRSIVSFPELEPTLCLQLVPRHLKGLGRDSLVPRLSLVLHVIPARGIGNERESGEEFEMQAGHVVIPQFNRDHVRTMLQQSHQAGLTGQFAELVCPHCNNVSLLVLISQGNISTHVFTRLQAIIF